MNYMGVIMEAEKRRKEVIVMAKARDDGSPRIYNTRIMAATTAWHLWENEIRKYI